MLFYKVVAVLLLLALQHFEAILIQLIGTMIKATFLFNLNVSNCRKLSIFTLAERRLKCSYLKSIFTLLSNQNKSYRLVTTEKIIGNDKVGTKNYIISVRAITQKHIIKIPVLEKVHSISFFFFFSLISVSD